MRECTLDDLRRILLDLGGLDDPAVLRGDIMDTGFIELGYDSLALLHLAVRIETEFGVEVSDVISEFPTPRAAIGYLNRRLTGVA
ncbi:act minimal PKS acyl carrier protein [Kibdelosporangium banguiense]|uniref:Act minimal PKS acyl carrier protein n=1 Tax=Kibdelosporangium banguiense TaxID=1365924 RepID=A0ABS4TFF8_9PSEU|nr:acyl carrier protein [Kibdelosporangium banguiense]MBP2323143.1 act minimal PKS acyl carrier protein [Kibdelosporangium banguiense]